MSKHTYIEDIFSCFADEVFIGSIGCLGVDYSAVSSFYTNIMNGKSLTKKQGDFVIRILKKYQSEYESITGDNISQEISSPVWKNTFRTIDNSRHISVHTEDDGIVYFYLKFPYQLKEKFAEEFSFSRNKNLSVWDPDLRVQKVKLFDINIIQLYNFVKANNFSIDQEFLNIVAEVEEIWNSEDSIIPHCTLTDGTVTLNNANENANNYFSDHKSNVIIKDLFLARSMGFLLKKNHSNPMEKIFSSKENSFWFKNIDQCFSLIESVDSYPVVILMDRSGDVVNDTRFYYNKLIDVGIDKKFIKVCFRFNNDDEDGIKFNRWVKESGAGGAVAEGKIFICQHRPPKWMLKEDFSPKILISNSLYPHTNLQTSSFVTNHHTVFYVGTTKPSANKETKIVEM